MFYIQLSTNCSLFNKRMKNDKHYSGLKDYSSYLGTIPYSFVLYCDKNSRPFRS